MQTRMIYLARRNPSTTHDEFVVNWREHIALGGQFPSVYRRFTEVVQCDVIVDPDLAGTDADVPGGFDGIEIAAARDLPTSISVWRDEAAQTHLVPDERRVFATIVQDLALQALGSVLIDGPRTPYVLARLLTRDPGLSREDFIREWSAVPLPDHSTVRRYARNYIILDPPAGVPFDGVDEVWFDTADDMDAYVDHVHGSDDPAETRLLKQTPISLPTRVGIAFPPLST
ncbi:EthD domain-containing protein [Aeromicrobium fastidiosum]|uniref:EthD domain-containing protein n=1 Tax=Aeromicrobium fastidiosum TaxID=52699 RepID=A0A641AP93_9ACTN|nr:hypothetical protein [Aeromicrobium fastidiosum]KAA1379910.1 hypothetical protein ESP62_001475 [Aeromicrobium fastidiosum]MBP2389416.1 hypothetical protein [Aeromicrobium fastidiosum]